MGWTSRAYISRGKEVNGFKCAIRGMLVVGIKRAVIQLLLMKILAYAKIIS